MQERQFKLSPDFLCTITVVGIVVAVQASMFAYHIHCRALQCPDGSVFQKYERCKDPYEVPATRCTDGSAPYEVYTCEPSFARVEWDKTCLDHVYIGHFLYALVIYPFSLWLILKIAYYT